jgi:predicted GH43/DUF377 family glycosyl hydrolase
MLRESKIPSLHTELFYRHDANPILTAQDWPYPAHTVFNAGACQNGDETVLLVRVEDRRGHSHLTVARSNDGVSNWHIDSRPSFAPDVANYSEEEWGVEDARLTWVAERNEWVIAYTAYSPSGPLVSLATTTDFNSFSRLGPVMPPEDKDAAVFPRKFGNRYAMIHRPVSSGSLGAHIWLSFSPDLTHWGDHHVLLHARRGAWWDANKIGLSPPPLETPDGWLLMYHGVRVTPGGCLYRLGLALLDLEDPRRVLRRSDEWIFAPETSYEHPTLRRAELLERLPCASAAKTPGYDIACLNENVTAVKLGQLDARKCAPPSQGRFKEPVPDRRLSSKPVGRPRQPNDIDRREGQNIEND